MPLSRLVIDNEESVLLVALNRTNENGTKFYNSYSLDDTVRFTRTFVMIR